MARRLVAIGILLAGCRSAAIGSSHELNKAVQVTATFPDSAVAGDSVRVAIVLRNTSSRMTPVGFYATPEWSLDPVIFARNGAVVWERAVRNATIMSGATEIQLSPGSRYPLSIMWRVPSTLPPADYFVSARLLGMDGSFIWTGEKRSFTIKPR